MLASSAGVNANVSNPDTETFYLYTFPGGVITAGAQVGLPIATLTAAQIEAGTPVGYSPTNTSDVYQLSLINSLSTYHLNANTTYAIVMMTSNASQDVGWAESKTAATGDMGDFDNLNHGGNNGGSFGQMELAITPDITVTPGTGELDAGGAGAGRHGGTARAFLAAELGRENGVPSPRQKARCRHDAFAGFRRGGAGFEHPAACGGGASRSLPP